MTKNINLDDRVLNMNERKLLLHLKNETNSEFTQVETQASEEMGGLRSTASRSMQRKQASTMQNPKKTLILETEEVQLQTMRPQMGSLQLEDLPPKTNSAVRGALKPSLMANMKEAASDYQLTVPSNRN